MCTTRSWRDRLCFVAIVCLGVTVGASVAAAQDCLPASVSPSATPGTTVLAEIRGGIAALPKIQERKNGCVPAGILRGVSYLRGTASQGDAHGPATTKPAGAGEASTGGRGPVLNGGGGVASDYTDLIDTFKWDTSGTPGTREDWARTKAAWVARRNLPIATRNVNAPLSSLQAFFDDVVTSINHGSAVELHISQVQSNGDTVRHFSMVSSVLRDASGNSGIVFSDDKGQGDAVAATEARGPFWFDPATGKCIGYNVTILGMLVESWRK